MSFRQGAFSSGGLQFGPGQPLGRALRYLLLANAALYFLPDLIATMLPGQSGGGQPLQDLWLQPGAVFAHGKIWQLVTYMFFHADFFHLFFNMLMLWMFGTPLEHHWGSRGFLSYYLVCGVGAALLQFFITPTSERYILGASGAIYGLLLAYGLAYPDRIILVSFIFPIRMRYFVWLMIGVSLLLGMLNAPGDRIAHFVHLGGALTGWLYLKQDWRLGALGRKLRGQGARRRMQQNTRRVERDAESRMTVDEILDKISAQGIDSLTEDEKRILREASRH